MTFHHQPTFGSLTASHNARPVRKADCAQWRALVDLISESRSKAVRVMLFGTLTHRPDPDGRETQADRDAYLDVLQETVRWLGRTHRIVTEFQDPWGEYPPQMCERLAPFLQIVPEFVPKLERLVDISDQVVQAVGLGGTHLGDALQKHMDFREDGYMMLVSRLCDAIWQDTDEICQSMIAANATTPLGQQQAAEAAS